MDLDLRNGAQGWTIEKITTIENNEMHFHLKQRRRENPLIYLNNLIKLSKQLFRKFKYLNKTALLMFFFLINEKTT